MMQNYTPDEVRKSIDELRIRLSLSPKESLQEEFGAGLHPNLLSYSKIQDSANSLPIVEKYLIGATSFLRQPSNYYDIFRACRCVKIVQIIAGAVRELTNRKIPELEPRLKRLLAATDHDTFDAVVFELASAARYAMHPKIRHVEFIKEAPPAKTAEFLYHLKGKDSVVECKKIDRTQDYSVTIRNIVLNHLNEVVAEFKSAGLSVLLDVVFHSDPLQLSSSSLVGAAWDASRFGTPIVASDFTISARRLPPFQGNGAYHLFPSPEFYWNRYGFRIRSEWFGLVNQYFGTPAVIGAPPKNATSSWIETIDWDAAAKWRISSEPVIAKYRRFAFDGVFKGIEQIKMGGPNSSVHIWLETEYFMGTRKNAFNDLLKRLSRDSITFGWFIINETLIDVSPHGNFDLIEHAHFIRGKTGTGRKAPVYGIFTAPLPSASTNVFGEGSQLPDIDA